MIDVVTCIVREHDLRLVLLAVVVCLLGSAATAQLFARIRAAHGRSRFGWIVLCAVGTGTMVWCTHFVAMMAFRAGVPVTLDPVLTPGSLAIAILLAAPGLAMAGARRRAWVLPGGAIVGVAVSAMHYTGMVAYRVDGVVEWRWGYVVASVVLASALSAAAFHNLRAEHWRGRAAGALLLGVAVAVLHFTGMAAMHIAVLALNPEQGLSSLAMAQLAIGTACASVLFIGCAAVSALIDSAGQSEALRQMRQMALHDGLTDLPNRLHFNQELERRRERVDGTPYMAVIVLDLARFKTVNDTYGHQAGDQLLVALAARMTAVCRPDEFMARLGGDEFAALVSYTDRADLNDFLDRLAGIFAKPFIFARYTTSLGANVGIAVAPDDGRDADTLLARADLAMYRAKAEHSSAPCFYDAQMDQVVRERRELAHELRGALAAGAFEIHYQVQADIRTSEISGYEALVRWRHPTRGMIGPATFIPLAEEVGEIVPLSNWILAQACLEAASWPGGYAVSVNLSPLQLADAGLVDTIRLALVVSGLPPRRLTLELTESAIIRDRHAALDKLKRIKAMGVKLALDDFGVGYSSLDILRSFPFDRIKLDKSFVDEIEGNEQAIAILRSVVALGDTLKIPILAEGVEVPEQLVIVAREGCSAIQGYLVGKPARDLIDPAHVRRAMARQAPPPIDLSLVA